MWQRLEANPHFTLLDVLVLQHLHPFTLFSQTVAIITHLRLLFICAAIRLLKYDWMHLLQACEWLLVAAGSILHFCLFSLSGSFLLYYFTCARLFSMFIQLCLSFASGFIRYRQKIICQIKPLNANELESAGCSFSIAVVLHIQMKHIFDAFFLLTVLFAFFLLMKWMTIKMYFVLQQ